ncbi:MAG: transposase [Xanthomarina gelatinilytica]
MIAHTNNFKSFQNWRKFACYAGIASFEHSSGTSYRQGNHKVQRS